MPKAMKGFLVLLAVLTVLGFIVAAIWRGGELRVINGLLKEGYRVRVNRSLDPGEGRYSIDAWETGEGWVPVER